MLTAWQANRLGDYAHIWRATDPREVEYYDAVLLVRRPDRRVHLVGAGGLGEHLRQLLRGGVEGWRLHELPVTRTPLNDAEPLLGPRVYAMLARYGFTTVERSHPPADGGGVGGRRRAEPGARIDAERMSDEARLDVDRLDDVRTRTQSEIRRMAKVLLASVGSDDTADGDRPTGEPIG